LFRIDQVGQQFWTRVRLLLLMKISIFEHQSHSLSLGVCVCVFEREVFSWSVCVYVCEREIWIITMFFKIFINFWSKNIKYFWNLLYSTEINCLVVHKWRHTNLFFCYLPYLFFYETHLERDVINGQSISTNIRNNQKIPLHNSSKYLPRQKRQTKSNLI